LGKTTFHLVALGEHNEILLRKKFSRTQLLAYTAKLPLSLIGLEACAGSHFLGAVLREQGHQVRLIPAQFVKPYRKSNKNDFLDAEAIAEAVTKQNMRFAQLKTQEQLDWQAMHRVRDRLVQRRTALINEIRGFLLEHGITFAAQPIPLRKNLPGLIEDAEQNLSGNVYLRRMLIHGARSVLFRVKYDTGGFGQWVKRLAQRAPSNKVVVAIANKLARIAWAVLSSGRDYRHQSLPQLAAA
jgi:transposase